MKRLLSIVLAAVMLLGVMPWQVFAEEPQPNVTLVGQWINDSSEKIDTPKHYELTDKIGSPKYNSGLLRGLAKQFLGWSDKAPAGNAELAEGAKLFSPEDKISDVFPNGIPKDAKIYAVYYELNGFDKPLSTGKLGLLDIFAAKQDLETKLNNNKVTINKNVEPNKVLKDTDLYKGDTENNTVIDYYKKTDDDKTINEVVLQSEFEMDWAIAMLAYKNTTGSNALRPILSRDYNTRYKDNNFPTGDGVGAGYTYVDLNMDYGTDEGLVIPENLFLEFKSYTWRPLYAFGINDDGTKTVLKILGRAGKEISESPGLVNQGDFEKIGSGDRPETTFGVVTKAKDATGQEKKYRKITIRVVLREWDNTPVKPYLNPFSGERISASYDEILSNMTLRVLGSADGIKNESIVRITDAKAKALADGEAKETIDIKGSIKGHVFASAGKVGSGFFSFNLASNAEINESRVEKPVKLSYIHKKEEPQPNPNPNPQPDPQGPFYKGSILILPEEKEKEADREEHMAYIFGYPDKSVKPEGTLTRAEAAAMVVRLGNLDLSDTTKADYPDLKDGAWYLPHINAALKAGMLDTDDAGMLRPDAPVTRGEFVKMIAAIDKASDGKAPFTDIAGHKYEKEINQVYGNGRALGYEDGSFKPDASLTRAEAAAFLNRVFNRVADDAAVMGLEDRLEKFTDLQKGTWYYYELVEATNSHELIRRGGQDELNRAYEKWIALLEKRAVR